jgi:gliding motility-associated lipoprotein GldB
MKNKGTIAFLFLFLGQLYIGCWGDKTKPNLVLPEVEEKQLPIKIERFEQDLFQSDTKDFSQSVKNLQSKYGNFFTIFTENILGIPRQDSVEFYQTLSMFVQDPDMKDVTKEIQTKYPSLEENIADLEQAFKYFKHYYPDSTLPRVVTMNSGFNYAVVTTDSVLAIGLDMYLGDSCQYYTLLGFPKYKTACMNREYLSTDLVMGWTSTVFEEPSNANTVLGKMIYQGKLLYILDAFLPDKSDELKMKYTKEQLKWCTDNEKQIWQTLINKKLLFSTKLEEMSKLVNDAPFTAGFPRDSPGRIGRWVGWQIVRKYMKKHPEIKLQDLLKDQDYDKIFRESNYKPV